jgi:pentatricopeptide repeat protein
MDPRYTDANIVRARDMVVRGSYDQAIAELQDALNRSSQREPLLLGALAHALGRAGRHKEALKLVDELQRIEAAAGQQYVPPFGLIWAYAGLGENDNAMRGLKQAFEEGSDRIMWLRVDPFLDPLRSDSAFVELVQRAGFPANPSKSQ